MQIDGKPMAYKARNGSYAVVLHIETNPLDGELGAFVWYAHDGHTEFVCEKTGRAYGEFGEDDDADLIEEWHGEYDPQDDLT